MRTRWATIIWLGACFALVLFFVQGVSAHDEEEGGVLWGPPEHVDICVVTPDDGEEPFSFPVGMVADLKTLCGQLDGRQVVLDAPSPSELVQWMYDLGLYDPYWLAPFDLDELEGWFADESPEPVD